MEVKDFEVVPDQKLSFSWAIKFQELFLKNLKNKGAPLKKIIEVGYEDFVEPIREMIENDGITETHLQLAYELLKKDEFWNGIILDTNKLREKIGQLIDQGKMPVKIKEMDIRVQDKIKSYD
jgi:pimeloyl-CoA synthetase